MAQIGSGIDRNSAYLVEQLQSSLVDGFQVNNVDEASIWMILIIKYLESGELPLDKVEAYALKRRVVHYAYKFRQLYK